MAVDQALVDMETQVKAVEDANVALKAQVTDLQNKVNAGVMTDPQEKKIVELTARLHALVS